MGVTVAELAMAKGLDPGDLRGFGVHQVGEQVRIPFWTASGMAARARIRTALRGIDGSDWERSDLPMAVYDHPAARRAAHGQPVLLIVEGESDCWTAWRHGLRCVGLPGADGHRLIQEGNLTPGAEVAIVMERDEPRTYPQGVRRYADCVLRRVGELRPGGTARLVSMLPYASDLNDLYRRDPPSFEARLARAIASAPALDLPRPA
jgi:hypothetical protein